MRKEGMMGPGHCTEKQDLDSLLLLFPVLSQLPINLCILL